MKIVVLAGGLSTERQVALTSGTGVCRALRERGHKAILVDMFLGLEDYEGALEELLDQLQKAASDEDTISCEFAEDVEIRQEYVPTSEIMNLGYIAELLYSTKTAEVTYEVKKGDTWSQIAAKNDMTSAELLALNPGCPPQ